MCYLVFRRRPKQRGAANLPTLFGLVGSLASTTMRLSELAIYTYGLAMNNRVPSTAVSPTRTGVDGFLIAKISNPAPAKVSIASPRLAPQLSVDLTEAGMSVSAPVDSIVVQLQVYGCLANGG
jgi:hypothetical protein